MHIKGLEVCNIESILQFFLDFLICYIFKLFKFTAIIFSVRVCYYRGYMRISCVDLYVKNVIKI